MPAPATYEPAQVSENVGLCSTYSTLTRSGPQTKTAYVFAASTTLSISIPSSRASAMCSSADSTSTARWLSSGRSGSPGSPWWNSTYAPPTSTRGAPTGPARPARSRARAYSSAVSSGVARPERDVVEVVLDVGRRLDEPEPQALARRRSRPRRRAAGRPASPSSSRARPRGRRRAARRA